MKLIHLFVLLVLLPWYVSAEAFVYLSDTAGFICGDSGDYSYEERYRRIHTLGNNISMGDVEYYLNFLNRPFEAGSLREGQLDTLKNDIADKLLAQTMLPKEFCSRFLLMVGNEGLGVVWRDYVLQKLPELYTRVEENEGPKVLAKLWEETEHTEHTFSGTALLGLYRLSKEHPEVIDLDQLVEQSINVVKVDDFPEQNKITALQLAAELKHPESLGLARSILYSESAVMLRVSAIGVLGVLGQFSDQDALLAYTQSSEFRLRRAAQAALDRMDKRYKEDR